MCYVFQNSICLKDDVCNHFLSSDLPLDEKHFPDYFHPSLRSFCHMITQAGLPLNVSSAFVSRFSLGFGLSVNSWLVFQSLLFCLPGGEALCGIPGHKPGFALVQGSVTPVPRILKGGVKPKGLVEANLENLHSHLQSSSCLSLERRRCSHCLFSYSSGWPSFSQLIKNKDLSSGCRAKQDYRTGLRFLW